MKGSASAFSSDPKKQIYSLHTCAKLFHPVSSVKGLQCHFFSWPLIQAPLPTMPPFHLICPRDWRKSEERRAAHNVNHECYLPWELFAGSCLAKSKASSRNIGVFLLSREPDPKKPSLQTYYVSYKSCEQLRPILFECFTIRIYWNFLPRTSLHPWKSSLVLFTERRIKDIIILNDWIVYISSGASLSLTCIVKSKINVASATQWLWLTIICILYWKSIVCMLPAVKLCNKQ